jgi:two-component system sensor histidine kinase YesM
MIISACLLFSYLVFYLTTISSVRIENTKSTTEQTGILIDSKSREIGLRLYNVINEFRILAQMPAFKSMDIRVTFPYIKNITDMKNGNLDEMVDLFAYGALNGKSWVNGEQTFELITRKEFLDIKNSPAEYLLSVPKKVGYLNTDFVLIYYLITNYEGHKDSLFIGGIKVDTLSELMKQIDSYGGTSWIMNSGGQVFTMNPIEFSHVMSYKEKMDLLGQINSIQSGTVEMTDSTVFYSPVPYAKDWILCTEVDNETMFAATHKIIRDMRLTVLLLSILGTIIAYLVSTSIVKPIRKLQKKMINVKSGNMDAYYTGRGKDEVHYLGQTYNLMLDTIKELIFQISITEEQKRKAYLQVLQAQINPHFLYNTLASLKWLAQKQGSDDVAEYIECLSNFFRISLSEGAEMIPLENEVLHAESYLKIQQFRYSDKIRYSFDMDRALPEILVPKLILQPLIENSIYHGLKREKRLGTIRINSRELEDDRLMVSIEDDGIGMHPERLKAVQRNLRDNISEDNFGLNNLSQRLKLHYGEEAELHILSSYHKGTSINLIIPIREKEVVNHV